MYTTFMYKRTQDDTHYIVLYKLNTSDKHKNI